MNSPFRTIGTQAIAYISARYPSGLDLSREAAEMLPNEPLLPAMLAVYEEERPARFFEADTEAIVSACRAEATSLRFKSGVNAGTEAMAAGIASGRYEALFRLFISSNRPAGIAAKAVSHFNAAVQLCQAALNKHARVVLGRNVDVPIPDVLAPLKKANPPADIYAGLRRFQGGWEKPQLDVRGGFMPSRDVQEDREEILCLPFGAGAEDSEATDLEPQRKRAPRRSEPPETAFIDREEAQEETELSDSAVFEDRSITGCDLDDYVPGLIAEETDCSIPARPAPVSEESSTEAASEESSTGISVIEARGDVQDDGVPELHAIGLGQLIRDHEIQAAMDELYFDLYGIGPYQDEDSFVADHVGLFLSTTDETTEDDIASE